MWSNSQPTGDPDSGNRQEHSPKESFLAVFDDGQCLKTQGQADNVRVPLESGAGPLPVAPGTLKVAGFHTDHTCPARCKLKSKGYTNIYLTGGIGHTASSPSPRKSQILKDSSREVAEFHFTVFTSRINVYEHHQLEILSTAAGHIEGHTVTIPINRALKSVINTTTYISFTADPYAN